MQIPRPEHPKPQFMRQNWLNLNGLWQFELDNGRSGEERGLAEKGKTLSGNIIVPFCPQSSLSGLGYKDFIRGAWYKKTVTIPEQTGRVRLHFGAVDYFCKVFVNGQYAGQHKGGYSSFWLDITQTLQTGENEIAVYVEDDEKDFMIPSGKQSSKHNSYGCFYTRTTGIWQTVWLEFVPENYVKSVKYYPNVEQSAVRLEVQLQGKEDLSCQVTFDGRPVGQYEVRQAVGTVSFTVSLTEKHLWQVGEGKLYDVELSFGQDRVHSYFGLREVALDGNRFLLNGKSVFQRLVLDQGFYPDGIYTAPTDHALEQDILFSQAVGFNGARLHEKVFEERFLYHADRLGYLVWGEYADWGLDNNDPMQIYSILPEWMEVVHRDFNHPSIIGWCPRNEVWNGTPGDCIGLIYDVTKAIDPTRPCIDASGGHHFRSDIVCVHDYNQDPVSFREKYNLLMEKGELENPWMGCEYKGEATFVSEYGGIGWSVDETGWSYGEQVKNTEGFYERFMGLTDVLLDNPCMLGLCSTQLTDVEQEQNGLYTFDRKCKFDQKRLYEILSRSAAIEQK